MAARSIEVERTRTLSGKVIAITGKLASMTREEAVRLIEHAGGRYVAIPGADTHWLVVGIEGWPLRRDGKPTRSLERAHELERDGHSIRVLGEPEFLAAAGRPERGEDLTRLYTTEQLGRILDVPAVVIRRWVRHGLIRPRRVVRRLCWFDFREVASAKNLQQLLDAGITTARIRQSLEQLEARLPDARFSLSQLENLERKGPLVVRLDDHTLTEPTGQLRFSFADERPEVLHTPPSVRRDRFDTDARPAQEWFAAGVRAEDEGDPESAADAYQQALLQGGPQPETCFNLGNVLHVLGRTSEAVQRYLVAVELDPEYVEAWNNLGNALCELGRHDDAISAYRRAIRAEPAYADAHFNLAETLHSLGRFAEARPHWEAYLARVPNAAEAAYVQRMIRECEVRG